MNTQEIINALKEVDGETLEHIIREIGMEDQMLRQLIMTSDQDRIEELYGERLLLEDAHNIVNEYKSFTASPLYNAKLLPVMRAAASKSNQSSLLPSST